MSNNYEKSIQPYVKDVLKFQVSPINFSSETCNRNIICIERQKGKTVKSLFRTEVSISVALIFKDA